MGRSVITYQFVAGIRNAIKVKVAGMDGEFEYLVTKARFEESRLRDLQVAEPLRGAPKKMFSLATAAGPSHNGSSRQQTGRQESANTQPQMRQAVPTSAQCFNCGVTCHLRRNCPQHGRAPPEERGRHQGRNIEQVAKIEAAGGIGEQPSPSQERVVELRRQLQEAEIEEALNTVTATLKGITSQEDQEGTLLGPTITTEVVFEEKPVSALVDLGRP